MKLNKKQMQSAISDLTNEVSDYILSRAHGVMTENLIEPTRDEMIELDRNQMDEVVCAVFKGLYHEK